MKINNYIKQFLAGVIFPAIIYPLFVGLAAFYGLIAEFEELWWVPFVFGLTNVLYFWFVNNKKCPIEDWNVRMLVTGGSLGIIISIVSVLLNGFRGFDMLIRLVSFPLIGALVWRYVTSYFNDMFRIKEK